MIHGLPIIGSNIGHIARYIKNEKSGFCVDPSNIKESTDHIINLLTDQKLYNEISKNAFDAGKKYTWDIMEKKLIDIYRKLE